MCGHLYDIKTKEVFVLIPRAEEASNERTREEAVKQIEYILNSGNLDEELGLRMINEEWLQEKKAELIAILSNKSPAAGSE